MRYAIYISGSSQRLYKYIVRAGELELEKVCMVISDMKTPDYLIELLEQKKIPFFFIDHKKLGKDNSERNLRLSNIMLEMFLEKKIDYMISFGGHLLAGELLVKYKWRLINFHPAILPMYPGNKAIDQAIEHGNTFLVGNTAHFIDEGMDTGRIILQSVVPLQVFFDAEEDEKYNSILDLQIEMLKILICLLEQNRIQIENNQVNILGADYSRSMIFPYVDENWKK